MAKRLDELGVFASLRNRPPTHIDADTQLHQEMNAFQAMEHLRLVILRMEKRAFHEHEMRVGALYNLLCDTAREVFQ